MKPKVASSGGLAAPEAVADRRGVWSVVGPAAVVGLALVVACNQVWNYDIFWHLKSGQWMLAHGQVLGHDPFSAPDPDAPNSGRWVNVHWLFQVLVAAVHGLGGFSALVVMKMLVFAATMGVLALFLRRRVPAPWLMLVGLWVILGVETRVRERPEIITFLLLTVTLALVESVRRGASPRRLWWLVPINALWVNLHGLYVVGIASAWAAVGGALLDRWWKRAPAGGLASRSAVVACLAASAACLVSPWPVEGALHPLLLQTRVSGQERMYSFGVQEFLPTYQINPLGNPPVMLAALLAVSVLAVIGMLLLLEILRAGPASLPLGHAMWFVMFLILAALAVRNVSLFVLVAGFLLAADGGELLGRIGQARPSWRKVRVPAAVAMLLAMLTVAGAFATEAVYRWQNRPANRFGLGLVKDLHPVEMARWLGQLDLPGDVMPLEFGDGGTFLYYGYPRRKVYMDGRLEVQSARRFERLYECRTKMLSSRQAGDPAETPLPASVRFIVVRREESSRLDALRHCERFQLVYVDATGACFARLPSPGERVSWATDQPLPAPNMDDFDRPLDPAGVEVSNRGMPRLEPRVLLTGAPTRRTWYRQNVPAEHWRVGALLYSLGRDDLAVRYLTVAQRQELQEPVSRTGMLAQTLQRLSEYRPVEPDADLPADPNLARALALYERMDLTNLQDRWVQTFALARIRGLMLDRQVDAADRAMKQYLEGLPVPRRWSPTLEEIAVRDSTKAMLQGALARKSEFDLDGLEPAGRAALLLRKDVGLMDAAVSALESRPDLPPRARTLLGDLYLRKGLVAKARGQYAQVTQPEQAWAAGMRLGLCDWADGDFVAALERLERAAETGRPAPALYLALLREQLGDYAGAARATERSRPSAEVAEPSQSVRLLRQVKARLAGRGLATGDPE